MHNNFKKTPQNLMKCHAISELKIQFCWHKYWYQGIFQTKVVKLHGEKNRIYVKNKLWVGNLEAGSLPTQLEALGSGIFYSIN